MDQFQTIEDIIAFAIDREGEAYLFYYDLSNGATDPRVRNLFREFAADEQSHREKLLAFRDCGSPLLSTDVGRDMRIADYLIDIEPEQVVDFQRALIFAMQNEKKAFQLYTNLAEIATDPMCHELALSLAREEANHKLHIEIEYDEYILTDN